MVNTLIHRELTSSFIAKFVIEKRNLCGKCKSSYKRWGDYAGKSGTKSENPIIAAFFRNIGYADQLGSGVRNLYKYSRLYSGKDPEFKEGDVFRITVPLEEEYSLIMKIEGSW